MTPQKTRYETFPLDLYFFKLYSAVIPKFWRFLMANVQLRSFSFIDSMQPQFASFEATTAQGYLPVKGQSALYVEVAPGMEIQRLLDVACKSTAVMPGTLVVERAFGLMEVHHEDLGEVRQAGQAVLEAIGVKENQRIKPKVTTSTIIRNATDYHTMLINRSRRGQ